MLLRANDAPRTWPYKETPQAGKPVFFSWDPEGLQSEARCRSALLFRIDGTTLQSALTSDEWCL